jgi:hypothetical protein
MPAIGPKRLNDVPEAMSAGEGKADNGKLTNDTSYLFKRADYGGY